MQDIATMSSKSVSTSGLLNSANSPCRRAFACAEATRHSASVVSCKLSTRHPPRYCGARHSHPGLEPGLLDRSGLECNRRQQLTVPLQLSNTDTVTRASVGLGVQQLVGTLAPRTRQGRRPRTPVDTMHDPKFSTKSTCESATCCQVLVTSETNAKTMTRRVQGPSHLQGTRGTILSLLDSRVPWSYAPCSSQKRHLSVTRRCTCARGTNCVLSLPPRIEDPRPAATLLQGISWCTAFNFEFLPSDARCHRVSRACSLDPQVHMRVVGCS